MKSLVSFLWQSFVICGSIGAVMVVASFASNRSYESSREPMSTEPDGVGRDHLRNWDHIRKFDNPEAGITREELNDALRRFNDNNDKNSRNGSE